MDVIVSMKRNGVERDVNFLLPHGDLVKFTFCSAIYWKKDLVTLIIIF